MTDNMKFFSTVFNDSENIPTEYTCDSRDVNPPLVIENIPEDTESLVIIMDDLNSETEGGIKNHWIVYNIKIGDRKRVEIDEDFVADEEVVATNGFDNKTYAGPCPYAGEHNYDFTVFAVSDILEGNEDFTRDNILDLIEGKVLATASFIGKYKRIDITEEKDYNFIDQEDRDEYRRRVSR